MDEMQTTQIDQTAGMMPPDMAAPPERKGPKPKRDFESVRKLVTHHRKTIKARDRQGYARRHKKWHENWLFYNGQQCGFFDEEGDGGYYEYEQDSQAQFYICNFLSWQIDTTQKEWARANTQLLCRPVGDKTEAVGVSRAGRDIMQHFQRKILSPVFQQSEGLTGNACGVYFRYTAYDPTADGGKGKIPRMEPRTEKMGEDVYSCPQCMGQIDEGLGEYETADPERQGMIDQQMGMRASSMGNMADLTGAMPDGAMMDEMTPLCPVCGGPLDVEQAPEIEFDEVVGEDEVPLGDIRTWERDPFGIRVDPRARGGQIESTSYIYDERVVDKYEAEDKYWWMDWDEMKNVANKDYQFGGLKYQRDLERQPGSVSDGWNYSYGYNEPEDEDSITIGELWMDVNRYKGRVFEDDQTFGDPNDPFIVPANVPLDQVAPNGLYVCFIGDKIADMRDEDKNKHWDCGVYRIYSPSFWGRGGMEDSVWQQKLLNDVYNMMVDYLRYCTNPTIIVNSNFIDSNMLSGQIGEVVTVENGGTDAQLSAYYLQVAPPPMPSSIPNFIEMAKRDIQAQLGAFAPLAGSPTSEMDISTATGIKLLREASIALIAMALAIKACVDASWGKKVLQIAQEHFWIPRAIMIERQHSQMELRWLSNCDIEGELEVTYARHSVTPRSESEEQNDFIAALGVGNMPFGLWNPELEQIAPEAAQLGRDRFNIPFDSDKEAQTDRLAKDRLDALKELAMSLPMIAEQIGLPTESIDPMNPNAPSPAVQWALTQVPIEPDFDDHPRHMRWYTNFMHEDEGMYADEILKQLVRARYNEHLLAQTMKKQKEAAAMVASQAPMMMAQKAMEPPPQPGNGKPPGKGGKGGPPPQQRQPQQQAAGM